MQHGRLWRVWKLALLLAEHVCLFDVAGSPDHGTSCTGNTDVTFIARSAQPEVVEALEFGNLLVETAIKFDEAIIQPLRL
jgi:hypothetical protein